MSIVSQYLDQYSAVVSGPAAPDVVDPILQRYGVNNSIYREWLISSGGGPIGPNWYDSPNELESSQKKRNEGWTVPGFVIGWDGAGNPIALIEDGAIIVEDHNFGGIHEIAKSFEALLQSGIAP